MSTEVFACWFSRENDWNPLWSAGLPASSACSRSRYSNSGAAACDSASRSIRPFLSIVGRCGKRSAPAANQTVLWRTPQRRWSDEELNCGSSGKSVLFPSDSTTVGYVEDFLRHDSGVRWFLVRSSYQSVL